MGNLIYIKHDRSLRGKEKPTFTSPCMSCGDPRGLAVIFAGKIQHICVDCARKIREGSLTFIEETNESIEVLS